MAKVLRLYNTFTRTLNEVRLAGNTISANAGRPQPEGKISASFYICGPTVYDDCHLGHALTYIRADLFRRFIKTTFNIHLQTAMNITDVDDKILQRASQLNLPPSAITTDPASHPFNKISEKYYANFLEDLKLINVQPADIFVRVSKHINLITKFIGHLERNGHTYIASNGDVYFKVSTVKNYIGRTDQRKEGISDVKIDERDFVLWKAARPKEPVWLYESPLEPSRIIAGRPGWHVQCSAICSALFGKKLDFHFGGKDLIFPHHYNEQACCSAFHQLDTSRNFNVWADNWLHSGHLVQQDSSQKMSKSLGNVVSIKSFLSQNSANLLRLLCIESHYRSDITYDEHSLERLKKLDHKLNAFNSYLKEELGTRQASLTENPCFKLASNATCVISQDTDRRVDNNDHDDDVDLENCFELTQNEIIEGVCDDMHLDRGLEAVLKLSKFIYSRDTRRIKTRTLIAISSFFAQWCNTCGLNYGEAIATTSYDYGSSQSLEVLVGFRNKVRSCALEAMKASKRGDPLESINEILAECDKVREEMQDIGYVCRDEKSK